MLKPALVLILILLLAYNFYILEVSHVIFKPISSTDTTKKGTSKVNSNKSFANAATYINWTIFFLLFTLTLWSLYQMVFSLPGYIPRNY